MKLARTWVLVADGALAQLYKTEGPNRDLVAIEGGEISTENLANREIDSDRPGQVHDRGGHGSRRMQPHTDSHRLAQNKFAHRLAEILQQAQQRDEYDELIIIAPPTALGNLRKALAPNVKKAVKAEVSKDLVHLDQKDLRSHLENVLRP